MSRSSFSVTFATEPQENTVPFKSRTVEDIQLLKWKKIKSKTQEVPNNMTISNNEVHTIKCANLPSGKTIFTEPSREMLQVYCQSGNIEDTIYLSGRPFDLAVISSKFIAVSYGDSKYVEIINLKTHHVINSFYWDRSCYGISVLNNEIYVMIQGRGIVVLDHSSGQLIKTLPVKINQKSFLHASTHCLVYTNWIFDTVHCIDREGHEKWTFKKNKLHRPVGITADGNGNIFVTGSLSGNILVISPDGNIFKELLRESDFIDVNFDLVKSRLLALKSNGVAIKYFVQ